MMQSYRYLYVGIYGRHNLDVHIHGVRPTIAVHILRLLRQPGPCRRHFA